MRERHRAAGWTSRDGRPGPLRRALRRGLALLPDPAVRGGVERTRQLAGGRVGMAATVLFGALYVLGFGVVRRRRHAAGAERGHGAGGGGARRPGGTGRGDVHIARRGGHGQLRLHRRGGVMFLPTRAAAVAHVAHRGDRRGAGDRHRRAGSRTSPCRSRSAWRPSPRGGSTQLMNRNIDLLLARGGERPARASRRSATGSPATCTTSSGHSLTVITVKAELAGRLLDVDPERARAEVADLERLSRDALADVRRAVEGYRELTLPGELARARAVAARGRDRGRPARQPPTTCPRDLRELFAWTVREGVTNVIRHSGATRCTGPRSTTERVEVPRRRRRRPVRGVPARPPAGTGWPGCASAPTAVGRAPSSPGPLEPRASSLRGRAGEAPMTIRLLLADDQALVRGALAALLGPRGRPRGRGRGRPRRRGRGRRP